MKNGQPRDIGNNEYTRHMTKTNKEKTQHRKLNNEQHGPHQKLRVNLLILDWFEYWTKYTK